MVNLDKESIEIINRINVVLENSSFELNSFQVGETGAGGLMINIDIRRHK